MSQQKNEKHPEPKKESTNDFSETSEEEFDDNKNEKEMAEKLDKLKNTGKKKMAISAESYGTYNKLTEFKPPVIEKTQDQIHQIKSVLKMSFMFNQLDDKDLEIVINAMKIQKYSKGQVVIKQGDDGAELFIVGNGTLKCEKIFPGQTQSTFLKTYQIGEVFGELSLMYNAPRAASIFSNEESVLFSLDRDTFNHIVKSAAIKKRELYENFLKKIELLSDLENYERAKICDCLVNESYKKGDLIIKEGEDGDTFYFIQNGTADAFKTENGIEKKVFEYKENDYFGELALLNDEKRKASIRVTSDEMLVAVMNKLTFKRILGPIETILKRNAEKYQKYVHNA